ncbi:MAG: 2'-5' RNA ligase family protein [Nakamurella sp.]
MYRLVVVLPLEPLAVGDGFSLKDWPLHLTVAPTFVIDTELADVLTAIGPVLRSQAQLTVHAGPDEGFGHSGKIPVTLIEPSAELRGLHDRLVDGLVVVGATFDDPEFVGQGYRPHVTVTRAARVLLGETLTLRQAALVNMAPAGHRRLRRVAWAQSLR